METLKRLLYRWSVKTPSIWSVLNEYMLPTGQDYFNSNIIRNNMIYNDGKYREAFFSDIWNFKHCFYTGHLEQMANTELEQGMHAFILLDYSAMYK